MVSAYLAYSVVLYFWLAHVSGYANMPEKSAWAYFIFYAPNLPWLLAHLYMGQVSFAAIARRFRDGTGRLALAHRGPTPVDAVRRPWKRWRP